MLRIIERIKIITKEETLDFPYFYDNLLIGLIGTIFAKAAVPRINPIPKDYFNAFKEVFEEVVLGGIEPEWTSLESCKNWDIIHTRFVYRTEEEHGALKRYDGNVSPYMDKKLPYLCPI